MTQINPAFNGLMAGTDFTPLTREQYEDIVVAEAVLRLKDEKWYKGVCTDTLAFHYPNIDEGVEAVVLDTWFWDGMYV